jgi:hypothetical protein
MKAILAKILMVALVVTTLVVSALAQQPDSGSPRPNVPGRTAFEYTYTAPDGRITSRSLPSNPAVPLTNYALGWVMSAPQEEVNLANEANQLIQQLGEAKSDSDRDKIKTKLSEVLEKQFDQRQKRHEQEIEHLEAQIKKLKDLIQKRQENRREIIARRLDQILRESQGLGW